MRALLTLTFRERPTVRKSSRATNRTISRYQSRCYRLVGASTYHVQRIIESPNLRYFSRLGQDLTLCRAAIYAAHPAHACALSVLKWWRNSPITIGCSAFFSRSLDAEAKVSVSSSECLFGLWWSAFRFEQRSCPAVQQSITGTSRSNNRSASIRAHQAVHADQSGYLRPSCA